ncbi:TPA: hypothetical protein ACN37W_004318 [Vibrio parahaemolyticus]
MNKVLLLSLMAISASSFAAEEVDNNISSSVNPICQMQNGGEMLNLSTSKWSSIPSDEEHSEVLLFENGTEVLINQQSETVQNDIKELFDKPYDVYVCVSESGSVAPVYTRR